MKNNEKIIGIFGGSSFLAKYAIEKLCKQGYRIKIGTRRPWLVNNLKTIMGFPGQIEVIKTNIFNSESVKNLLNNCDYCINFCGQLCEKKITFEQLHAHWPEMLAKISNKLNIKKLIHISALNPLQNHPSKYMSSKMLGEDGIKNNIKNYFILRPSLVIGNGDDDFFSTFGMLAQLSPVIPIPGTGKNLFSPVHVSDCADAIAKLLETENLKDKIFEITGPKNYSFKNLIEIFLKEIKRKRILVSIPWRIMKIQSYFLQYLPKPFTITPDQILLLKNDSIPTGKFPLLKDLGINPKDINSIFKYWIRYRTGGEFNK